jgi:hypothetical protein
MFLAGGIVYAYGAGDALYAKLTDAILHKKSYTEKKIAEISQLEKLRQFGLTTLQQYELNDRLINEFIKFRIDSALYYADINLKIAVRLRQPALMVQTELQQVNLYSSSGKFRESERLLKSISPHLLPRELQVAYYDAYIQFFEHYNIDGDQVYDRIIESCRDSLLITLDPSSLKYKINSAQRMMYLGENQAAKKTLISLLQITPDKDPDYPLIGFLLGLISEADKDLKSAKKYYMISALADIKNAIKDNASSQNLALIYYKTNDIDNAYFFSRSALEDNIFCGVKFRTMYMAQFFSIIDKAYIGKEAKRQSELERFLLFISLLSASLAVAVVYVYRQMRRVSWMKEQLSVSSKQLELLNREINETNAQLKQQNLLLYESDKIKEAYIAQFFDLCSAYINKLEIYRKTLKQKATHNQLDELMTLLKSTTAIDAEVDELYNIFDNIFLNLYPGFICDYNRLLIKEEWVYVKPGELLTPELRIFALIRLGITDSVKIATFLRYSHSTVYNYRTKARNKALCPRDEFEEKVMKIGQLSM